ncbi:MAG: hypothetical protein JKY65_14150 [Planctomycetes bacterium]|nr:hypothetical protein [Planctomycetota bacterium]
MKLNSSRRGLTLVEIVISAGLLMVFLGMSLTIFMGFNNNMRDQMATVDLEAQSTRVEKMLRTELRSIQGASITLSDPFGATRFTRIEYRPVLGFDDTTATPVLGPLRRLDFVLDAGELIDNASNDNDRYIDEGSLVLTVDTNNDGALSAAEAVVIATNIGTDPESYEGGPPVGFAFQFRLGANPTSNIFTDQTTTGFVQIDLTFLGQHPNTPNGVRLLNRTWQYPIRNP